MMRAKRASEIFHPVDPSLNVIDRGYRRKGKLTNNDWNSSGGAICPRCNNAAVRFRPQDGVCWDCARALNEKQDKDDEKRARQLKFIKQHNARIDRKRATK